MTAEWSVAVLTSRETPETLAETVRAALLACQGRRATVDVVVNGNRTLAEAASGFATSASITLRVWDVPLGDKAHAWTHYLRDLWPGAGFAFFIDGYAAVRPDALEMIEAAIIASPIALAGTGVPSLGRSAAALREEMTRTGGLHGNLYALKGEVMRALRDGGFRLPLGLYRTDPLLTSTLCFNLDPAANPWNWKHTAVAPDATWSFRPLAWYRPRDLLTHLRRMRRQYQGELERHAYSHHLAVLKRRPEDLPDTAARMVEEWMRVAPEDAEARFRRNPLLRFSARKLLTERRDWSAARMPARLVAERR